MNIQRGEIYKARFPHAAGTRGKKRPVLVVQANAYNLRLRHVVVAQFTTNLSDANDPACLVLKASSPEGIAAGIQTDSLISSYLLNIMTEERLTDKIGELTDQTMQEVDKCLKAALGII